MQFEILSVSKNTGAAEMLLEKCINVSKTCAALWLEEPINSRISGSLNANGFVIEKPAIPVLGLPVESVPFVKYF